MDITPLIAEGTQIIQGYGNGGFKINGEAVKGNVIVLPEKTISWNIGAIDSLTAEHLTAVIKSNAVDILLVGCGERLSPFPAPLRQQLKQHGISVDCMDTGAACRTYNVLLSEGRNIAAALIAVE